MFWDPVFEHVSALAGAPTDQVKLIFALLVSFPLGNVFVRLPASRPNLSHLFSLCVTTFFLWPLLGLGVGYVHLLVSCAVTYLLVASSSSKQMPWLVFTFVMGHLTVNHIHRTFLAIPTSAIEISGSQMVLAMKLTTFAWNVHDGRQKLADLDEGQRATRLTQLPGPLPFLGYCFFFPSVLVGPSFDYATYNALVTHTIYEGVRPTVDEVTGKKRRRVPRGRKRVAYLHLVIGVFFLSIYASFGARGDYSRIITPLWYTWSKPTRFGYIQLAGFMARTKYYAVWSLSEGACILTGIGFNGYDTKTGRTLWNRVRNIDIVSIETAESFKVLFDSWNCRTNVWLRDQVYKRLTPKGKKPGTTQSMATFVTSAFWHGIAPGYYLAFVTAGMMTSLGRQFRHYVRPYFLPKDMTLAEANSLPRWRYYSFAKAVYDMIGFVMVQINLNYVASAFLLLGFSDCINAWSRMGWYSHILIASAMAFFHLGGRRVLRSGLPKPPPRTVGEQVQVPSLRISPPSPPTFIQTPSSGMVSGTGSPEDERDLQWLKDDLQDLSSQSGVAPDGGLFDRLVKGIETPRSESPRPHVS